MLFESADVFLMFTSCLQVVYIWYFLLLVLYHDLLKKLLLIGASSLAWCGILNFFWNASVSYNRVLKGGWERPVCPDTWGLFVSALVKCFPGTSRWNQWNLFWTQEGGMPQELPSGCCYGRILLVGEAESRNSWGNGVKEAMCNSGTSNCSLV